MRLLSLAPSNTEIVAALGGAAHLVAVTRYCDYPPGIGTLPKVGGWTDVDDGLVAGLRPDLILTSTGVQHEAERRFAALGLAVLHVDPHTLGDVRQTFRTIGDAIGRQDEATTLIARFDTDMQAQTASGSTGLRVYVEEWHQPPTPSGNWVPELIQLAGGVCPLLVAGERSRPIPETDLLAFDPELIVLSLCGVGQLAKAGIVHRRPGWAGMSACQGDRVVVIDDSLLNRPGPRLTEGLALLRQLISG
ncbi:MAG: cobalamin-binding protein [Candidatus Sericytochromatia bacterium]|nr:cobalamin-binding protein [Candidatus Sericytochromatia bacterium]